MYMIVTVGRMTVYARCSLNKESGGRCCERSTGAYGSLRIFVRLKWLKFSLPYKHFSAF